MPDISFDPKKQKAVLKCSICNGEQVAGFKNIETGAFTEVMLIKKGTGTLQITVRNNCRDKRVLAGD